MNQRNSIMLYPVSNGWIVQMPIIYQQDNIAAKIMGLGRKIQEDQMADPLLKKIREENNPPKEEKLPEVSMEEHIKDPGTYIFASLEAALGFISKEVRQPPVLQQRSHGGPDFILGA